MDYDLIIFDCDGVLVDSEVLAIRAMCDVLNRAGVPASEAMILRCFGMKQADTLLRIAEETSHDIPSEVATQLWPATRAVFETSLKAMPGVTDFLARATGVKRCVASSSHPDRIEASLRFAGLGGYFGENVFSSHQVARGKPAPDLFLFAAARMDAEPRRCLVIEDSVYGIQAGRAAGMTPYGFCGGAHVQAGHADELRRAGAFTVLPSWPAVSQAILPQS